MVANYGVKFSELASPSTPISLSLRVPTVSLEDNKNYLIQIQDILGLINKATLGLDKVDNTPDTLKPISQATQLALDGKADVVHRHHFGEIDGLEDYVTGNMMNHSHPMSAIGGLVDALDGKSDKGHGHSVHDISGLVDALDSKADRVHIHSLGDINGATETIQSLWASVNGKAERVHTHSPQDILGLDVAVKDVIAGERENLVLVDVGRMEW